MNNGSKGRDANWWSGVNDPCKNFESGIVSPVLETIFVALPLHIVDKNQPMHLILEGTDDHEIDCHHCRWHGKTSELRRGEYFVLTNITELFCPACKQYLGFIQHDTSENDRKDSNGN
jgi:hypothetical protein